MVGLTPLLWKSCGLIIQSWLVGSPRVEINYPLFWHSSPSHYWHYIWKLSHLLGASNDSWFQPRNEMVISDKSFVDESSYYSYYHSSHVWLVASMQCKAILIKKYLQMFGIYFKIFPAPGQQWQPLATRLVEGESRSRCAPAQTQDLRWEWWWVGF